MLDYNIIKCTDNDKGNIFYNNKYGICDLGKQIYDRFETYYEIPLSAIEEIDNFHGSTLKISNMGLTSLEWLSGHPKLDDIEYLFCHGNKIRNICISVPNIKYINCSYNILEELPEWKKVEYIDCSENELRELPLWPNIKHIGCTRNKLIKLPSWPKIKRIYCDENNLVKLPSLEGPGTGWPRIRKVFCNNNQLTELPEWQNIVSVDCSNNKIEKLPNWLTVNTVNCSNNQIEKLPNWLIVNTVNCRNNKIEKLPLWPNISRVYCSNNKIEKLPLWPNVKIITCDEDKLRYIPYYNKIEQINYYKIGNKYRVKRILFNYIIKINKQNKDIRMSMRIHELKWRKVNAEIVCRPNSGIYWHKFQDELDKI